ncbi:MAG TPA: DUF1217 domain-containing protein, partial [Rhizobiaceae bacterium]|nr:DUF1217 domain-containing protein [Rhizobiaceae bacterium]
MLTTYLSYQLITRDISKSMSRIQSQPMIQRETEYYLANIGKVKSIEEFVNDDRLFRYAMKAHGLEDMAYAKAFMVKALEEGVSDPESFANKLTDKRYAEFVKAYNFEKYGELATSFNAALHDVPDNFALQVELGISQEGYDQHKAETAYYLANISDVKSIDDLMADERLLSYSLAAFGLDAETESRERIREMLEGGVSDPQSPANRLYDKRYAAFVAAFDFVEHGEGTTARDEVQKAVPKNYMGGTGLFVVKPRAEYVKAETEYYLANISDVKSIDDLLTDKRLLAFAMASYGLDAATESPERIREMLEGGISDPNSPANRLADKSYVAFVAAFNFVEHGELTTSRDEVLTETPKLYGIKSELGLIKPSADYVRAETAYYLANVTELQSIDELMADKRLLDFALFSYGIDPAAHKPEYIRSLLEGGISDPDSPANKLTDKRYAAFVAAFNFHAHG